MMMDLPDNATELAAVKTKVRMTAAAIYDAAKKAPDFRSCEQYNFVPPMLQEWSDSPAITC